MAERTRFDLAQDQIPTSWFNIMPSIVGAGIQPLPPLHPGTHEPVTPDLLAPLFPEALIMQEMSTEQWIDIPGAVLDVYRLWRPSPLVRATRLEQALETPARIYFKYEGVSPAGSHKPNTAVAQVYFNKEAGTKRLATETGAGQWGSALSMACRFFGIDCQVFMVRASYEQKPYRRIFMETFGAEVVPSPSPTTQAGKAILEANPDSTGSLGIAISEAVETAATSGGAVKYSLGSVLNHVLLHQTVVGLEAKEQMLLAGDDPDVVIGCVGGGSNYAGLAYPFMADRLSGEKPEMRFLATEPAACPTLTRGEFRFDFGDTGEMTPLVAMYTLGHTFVPAPVHAGGLRYHGDAPSLSLLVKHGHMEAVAYTQNAVFEAATTFARTQGIIPAPESAHAVKGAIDEALAARTANEERVILFGLSGHGFFDMQAYDDFQHGRLPEVEYKDEDVVESLKHVPDVTFPRVTVAGLEIHPLAERELQRVCAQMSWRSPVMHEQRLREQLEGRYRYLIAFIDAVAIGHVGLFFPSDRNLSNVVEYGWCGLVHDLFVAPGFRRRGIGRALMEELERHARVGGLVELALGTGLDEGYGAARTLYRSMGWEPTSGPFVETAGPAAGARPPMFIEILTTWRKRLL